MSKRHDQPEAGEPAPEQTVPASENFPGVEGVPEDAAPAPAAEAQTAAPEAPAPDPVETLKEQLAALNDQHLRLAADYQNYRKRMAKEIGDARRIGVEDTILPFLQVFDLFGMAIQAAEKSDNVEAIKQGQAMILAQFHKALEELGVTRFDAVGTAFDPAAHDAVSTEPDETVPEGKIIKQWNCGYRIGDRLLRPARVVVSSGPAKPAEPAE